MRCFRCIAICALSSLYASQAGAVPPPAAIGTANLSAVARWIQHRVIPGDRLQEISERYAVAVQQICEWNGIDLEKPLLRTGQQLRIFTTASAVDRKRRSYTVREGDTWAKIARRFDVGLERLRRAWNPQLEEELRPGDQVKIWIEKEAPAPDAAAAAAVPEAAPEPETAAPEPARKSAAVAKPVQAASAPAAKANPSAKAAPSEPTSSSLQARLASVVDIPLATNKTTARSTPVTATSSVTLPLKPQPQPQPSRADDVIEWSIVPVPQTGMSIGRPNQGRLAGAVQIPPNDALYTIRNPAHSWGSTHAIEQLQWALVEFRQSSGFDRQILVCDMSRKTGGRFRPHHSHRSGRDVDIRLPLKRGVPENTIPEAASVVDWDATWALVKALMSTNEVKYIFLSRSRQRPLYEAALRAGETRETLRTWIQYPEAVRGAVVRHSQGHVKHIHVRFKCGPNEKACVDHP